MSDAQPPTEKQLKIRKYPNRRYYDVTRSQHLTLEDIRTLVRDGYNIRVTDSKTSADITAKVLAQIILELDAEKIDVFPVAFLTRLIRVNDRMVQDFMENYFDQALGMFLQYRQQVEDQLRGGGDSLGNLFANWNRAMFNPFGMPFMGLPGVSGVSGAGPAAGAPGADAKDLQDKIDVLEKQISKLEAKLGAAESGAKPKGRRAKK